MALKVRPFESLAKRFPKREPTTRGVYAFTVVRRAGAFRLLDNGQIENGKRDFRRDLAAEWRANGLTLSGRQFRKLRRADRHPEPPSAA